MKQAPRLAAQLYTLRDFARTPCEIASALGRVREMGYGAVEIGGLGEIGPDALKGLLDREGLEACAAHVPFERLLSETEAVAEELLLWGCRYAVIPILPDAYGGSAEGYARFAREASELGGRLAERGLSLCYHNHSFEFERFGGRTGMGILAQEGDPEVLSFEVDTYWVQHGGANPAGFIRNLRGRAPLVHLKDVAMRGWEQVMTEVGEGNIGWDEVLAACREAGTLWCVVEQDHCERDPFESLAISLKNLGGFLPS